MAALTVLGCGGGGGNGGSRADVFYVRASAGNDANAGTAIGQALRTIQAAVDRATDGDTIIIGPGTYAETVTIGTSGTATQPIILEGDPSGTLTGDPAGTVTIDAASTGEFTALHLRDVGFVLIDRLRITGASGNNASGVVIRNGSREIVIQHCEVFGNDGDGIRVQDSRDALVFNNLIHDNTGRGIAIVGTVSGAQRARIINNTVVWNTRRGIEIGTSSKASRDAFLRNNIIEDNTPENIRVASGIPSSLDGYNAQFNLVFPATYNPPSLPRANDLNEDARLAESFLLTQTSPAIDRGSADFSTMPSGGPLVAVGDLRRGTAVEGQSAGDSGTLDLGYHLLP